MAMQFSRAQRAENPDLAQALAQQAQIVNQLKAAETQAEAQNFNSMMTGGALLGDSYLDYRADQKDAIPPQGSSGGGGGGGGAGAGLNMSAAPADLSMEGVANQVLPTGELAGSGGGMSMAADPLAMGAAEQATQSALVDTLAAGGGEALLQGAAMEAAPVVLGETAAAAAPVVLGETAAAAGPLAGLGPPGWAALAALSIPMLFG